jgi:predicted permease
MPWIQRLRIKLRTLFRGHLASQLLDDELQFHLEQQIAENLGAGMSQEDARSAAMRVFGNHTSVAEDARETWGWIWLEQLGQDLRYAFRALRRSPLFAVIAILTLALGIGANTAIFSLLDQVLLQALPVKQPEQLVLLAQRGKRFGDSWGDNDISYPMYRDLRDRNQVFSDMFCRFPTSVGLSYGDHTESVAAELVSGSYFPTLGVDAAVGRILTPDDDRVPGGHPVAVLSYRFWQTRFSSDRSIVGKTIVMNGYAMTVIGVAQAGFDGVELGYKPKVFIPVMMQVQMWPRRNRLIERSLHWVTAYGRLKPDISIAQAKASLQPLMLGILKVEVQDPALRRYSDYDRARFLKSSVDLLAGSRGWSGLREQMQTPLWVLAGLTGAILLLACANLANLLLARATARERDMAVRAVIGAGRARIARLLLVESLLLSAFGTAVGLGVAFVADHFLLATYLPADATGDSILSATPDVRVLGFAFGAMLLTSLAFGLAPAIHGSRTDLASTLNDRAGSGVGARQVLLRKLLVACQVALSLLLLIGASLFLRTLANLEGPGPGFPTERLMAFGIDPSLNGYSDDRAKDFFRGLTEELRVLPGVSAVGLSSMPLLQGRGWSNPVIAEGYSADPGQQQQPVLSQISPDLFTTLGVPILAGREFNALDTIPVAVINETFARTYFAGRNPIGLHIGLVNEQSSSPDTPNLQVIGVVKDIKFKNLRDAVPSQAYFPYLEYGNLRSMTYYLRTRLDPRQLMVAVGEQVRRLDPNVPLVDMRTIDAQISTSLTTERLVASLAAVFGGLAAGLAMIGLYGVTAFTVARRTREIGIRMALGAQRGEVIRMVMREVLMLTTVGIAIGIPLALALGGLVRGQLYGLSPRDPVTIIASTLALATAAALAGFIPARRASRIDPNQSLRND